MGFARACYNYSQIILLNFINYTQQNTPTTTTNPFLKNTTTTPNPAITTTTTTNTNNNNNTNTNTTT